MARPPDPDRRGRTLARAADYVLEHGLSGLSLRPLARALGTSPRMLLYDFGTKERLVAEVLAEIRRREAGLLAAHGEPDLKLVWEWISAPAREPFLRLFFETYVLGLGGDARAMVEDWLDFLRASWGLDDATATLYVAVVRGLLLDRLATADRDRTDAAFALFSHPA
jgi:AcrR family transcriptional regulator